MLLPHIPVSLCSCRTAGGIILVLVMVTARVTDQVMFCIHVIVSLANVWYPPSFTLTTSGEGLCEQRWEGGKGVEGQNVSQVCQVILAFSACGDDVTIRARWQIPYRPNSLPYGRSFIVSWAGTRYAHTQGLGDNGGKQRLAETGLPFSSSLPQEHWVSEALSWMFSCRVAERKKENVRSWLAFLFLPVLPPYLRIQNFRKLVC